jgi:SAM-dependent methyltransferase
MPRRLTLPDTASIAHGDAGGRLTAPSAARNAGAIGNLVAEYAPQEGRALEIASGTGQHVAALADRLPRLLWQPSDIDPARRASIDAWAEARANIAPARALDATSPGWAAAWAGLDLILVVNLVHLVSTPEARVLISEAAQALAPNGRFILYGPFLRDGETTSEGDARFHASLRAQDPEIGYKSDWDIIEWLQGADLDLCAVVEMPANNLAFVSRKS